MKIRQDAGEPPVYFLREGVVLVECPQARFHVAYLYLLVKSGKACRKTSGCIAVNQDYVGPFLLKNGCHAFKGLGGNMLEALPFLHDIKIITRHKVENIKDLVKHLPVLGRNTYNSVNTAAVHFEFFYKGSHLDGIGPCAEDYGCF